MPLLDRFRAQPRQKHPDPAVRLAFVQEIPIDERDLLAEIARDDADARVRRAAVAKLMDLGGARQRSRSRTPTKRCAIAGDRRCCATSRSRRFEGVGEAESLAAVDALTDAARRETLGGGEDRAARGDAPRAPAGRVDRQSRARIDRAAWLRTSRCGAARSSAARSRTRSSAVALNSEFKDPTRSTRSSASPIAGAGRDCRRAPRTKSASKRARTIAPRDATRRVRAAAAEKDADAAALAEAEAGAAPPSATAAARRAGRRRASAATRQARRRRRRAAEAERIARRGGSGRRHRRAEQDAAERARDGGRRRGWRGRRPTAAPRAPGRAGGRARKPRPLDEDSGAARRQFGDHPA